MKLKKIFKVQNTRWGYEIDYLLSGYFKIHPNYIDRLRESGLSPQEKITYIIKIHQNLKPHEKSYFNASSLLLI